MIRFVLTIALVLGSLNPSWGSQQFDEYQVKAAFVANFTGFVEWPQAAFRDATDTFTICVVGRSPFGRSLADVAAGKSVAGRALRVMEISDASGSACQIAFISASEHRRFRSLLDGFKACNTLTVGDTSDFIAEGGMIQLSLDNGRVRIKINADAAKAQTLRISSHLLSLAEGSK
jgi:hypothetical protein